MFKVFISIEALTKLCVEEMPKEKDRQCPWFLLLTKQNIIYLDRNIYDEWEDPKDPLFIFSESDQNGFRKSPMEFNSIIKNTPEVVLSEPQGAFLLDVDKVTAESIQNNYGVICQSTTDLAECSLITNECKLTLLQNSTNHSWKELFKKGVSVPSNSLIIVDRYIFGYEGKLNSNYGDGVENIKQILQCILPKTLSCEYHVLVLFDANSSKDKCFDIKKVSKQLENFKNNVLKRPFNVEIELYSVTNKCANYEDTHNRKIISNYFMCSADHLLKAFRHDGTVICNQDIRVECVYSHGINDFSDSAVATIDHLVSQFQNMHQTGIAEYNNNTQNANEYVVMCGTNQSSTVNDIKNRLLLQ